MPALAFFALWQTNLTMSISLLIILVLLFFFTSVIGVVTGSNSLITVPVMFQFGVDEKVAMN